MEPNQMSDEFWIPTVVEQKIVRAEKGAYVMEFSKHPAMNLAKFTEKAGYEEEMSDADAETMYWKNVNLRADVRSGAPLYGIDNEVSLFPEKCNTWNLNKINGEDSIIHQLNANMPGILTPFLNNGSRNTSFGW